MPNLEGISAHFQTQIEQHKQEIIIIEATRGKLLMSAKAYWQSYKSKHALALRQTLICSSRKRCQTFTTNNSTNVRLKNCVGRAINIKQHFAPCHKHMTKADIENTLKVYDEMKK